MIQTRSADTLSQKIQQLRTNLLLRNSLYIMATTGITSLLGYGYWLIAAHVYAARDVGLASALIAAMMLTSNVSCFGFGSILIQTLPKSATDQDWSIRLNAAFVGGGLAGLIGGGLTSVLLMLTPQFAPLIGQPAAILTFLIGVPLWTLSTLIDSAFTAERANSGMFARNTIFSALKIPLLLIFLTLGGMGLFASWVVASLIAALAGVALLKHRRKGYTRSFAAFADWHSGTRWRDLFMTLAGHHLINVGGSLPMYLLPVIVTARLSAADNAYFYTTWMVGGLFFMVSPAVATALFAEGSYTASNLRRKTRSSAVLIGLLLIPAMIAFLVAGRLILSFFGSEYAAHGTDLLSLLVISAVPDAITNVYVSVLRVKKRLRAAGLLNVGMAVIALALAWILLPNLGIAACGWAWIGAQSAGSLVAAADYGMSALRRTFGTVQ